MECRPVVFFMESGDHSGQECEESHGWTWFVNVFEFANPHLKNGPHSVITGSEKSSLMASVRNGQSQIFCTSTWGRNRENLQLFVWSFKSPAQSQKQDFQVTCQSLLAYVSNKLICGISADPSLVYSSQEHFIQVTLSGGLITAQASPSSSSMYTAKWEARTPEKYLKSVNVC